MLSHRFDDALGFAAQAHRSQTSTLSDAPYIAHPLAVCALVLEYGGDETSAIAALLHDTVIGPKGSDLADQIEARFGAPVIAIVKECAGPGEDTGAPWRARKSAYVASLATVSDAGVLVVACDTLHNAGAIFHHLRSDGLSVFSQLGTGRDDTVWYYRELSEALSRRAPYALTLRLSVMVAQLEAEICQKLNSDD